ncbi:MAG: hypothetical protein A3C93_03710 [Candidatus Lloydbacteria bacterium RIFCSPHIGHO2_02_FULL_54_17]|uniref:Uncharacterized protein n=1 Tax=Candidatus Lloydbacteria bacterium RIFCSPHIGHO2_02_FULL_54_17 TaxID=1798664 RepID=A0A1G2DF50_9BACT|nr:MAG: hypothetical protein A2762_04680 [Candidatus Lloydbacteria bacterium RIFCSPHIGHO2_01_FULL_54_11]OGZ12239.1 MAG: hypothetical protein A3C93_03710 [Candidatus Lloydbacteria bacterium RIFCSPHIGHO2_02_FULL_54_17]OGZ14467.1 MAG: hypothetical protein A2948_02870 [Candidatus Lloydbacteria bacterium RIFCSPLOWO2_01_FULL_54_18]
MTVAKTHFNSNTQHLKGATVNRYFSNERFAAEFLRPLVAQHPLHLLFLTCHMVKVYASGEVETRNPRLRITIVAGHSLGASIDTNDIVPASYARSLRLGQASVRNALGEVVLDGGEHTLLVAYAGKDSFTEGLAEALLLRKKTKQSTLVLLTCNCALEEKLRAIGDDPSVGALYVTEICGGMSAMRDILEVVLKGEYPTLQ